MHGNSLIPILKRVSSPDRHRECVRGEYYRALAGVPGLATVVRSERFKQAVYDGHGLGGLSDLAANPGEFDNLWDDARMAQVGHEHTVMNCDALAMATDVRSAGVSRY